MASGSKAGWLETALVVTPIDLLRRVNHPPRSASLSRRRHTRPNTDGLMVLRDWKTIQRGDIIPFSSAMCFTTDTRLLASLVTVDGLPFGWHDTQKEQYVAIKIGISDSLPHEVRILRALGQKGKPCAGASAIPTIPDEFHLQGPNGSHPCYTTPVALDDLRKVSFSRFFPLQAARAMTYELTLVVAYIHGRGYAHDGKRLPPLRRSIHLNPIYTKNLGG